VREQGDEWWQMRCRSVDSHDRPLMKRKDRHFMGSHDHPLRNSYSLMDSYDHPLKDKHDHALTNNRSLKVIHAQAAQAQVVSSAHDRAGGSSMLHVRAHTDLRGPSSLRQLAVSDDVHVACPGYESQVGSSGSGWGPPMIVSVIERVQSGLIGETLSSMGITGLYVTLVFGLGRFLRMGLTNIRMRIPYPGSAERGPTDHAVQLHCRGSGGG
jgi:hypothetical protein